MNDNVEKFEKYKVSREKRKAYADRLSKLARKVSDVLDDVELGEVAFICARISGFAVGQLPSSQQTKVLGLTMDLFEQAVMDGNAVRLETEE